MDEKTILSVLKEWNPWEKTISTGIRRDNYMNLILPHVDAKEVLILKGIRRSGKSTILKQLIMELVANGVDEKQILYLNLEDYNFANDLAIDLFEQVLAAYRKYSRNRKKTYMFVDEVQKIPGWEKWIRTMYDRGENIKFLVTGSSASLLSRELSTLMTGRNLTFVIYPLTFQEFCRFKKSGQLEEYLLNGGFPEVVLKPTDETKKALLRQYLMDIINRDIVDRHNIRNSKQLIQIARYLISSSGGKVSISKLSKVFGLSQKTLSLYISYMIDAYLLYEVPWFSYSVKARHDVSKRPKLYCMDNGLISVTNVKYSQNRGQMYENTVLVRLAAQHEEVHYWSEGGSEVDFVVRGFAINVTATDDIPEREQKGLVDFTKRHRNFATLLVTPSTARKNMVSLQDFLLGKISLEM